MRKRMASGLAGPVTAVSVLLLIVGVSGAWHVHRLQLKTAEVLDRNVGSIRAAEELELLVREMRSDLNRYLLSEDAEHLATAADASQPIHQWLDVAVRHAISPEEKVCITRVAEGLNRFFAELPAPHQAAATGNVRDLIERLVDDVLTAEVLPNAREYLDINERELETTNEQQQSMAGWLALALLLLGTCGSAAGVMAGYGVARRVRRSLLELSVPIRDVAGKLNEIVGPISVSADAGLHDLGSALQDVVVEVGGVIEKLHQSQREVLRTEQLAAIGQLAAGLAHELRNPLMCMKLLVQSARPDGHDEPGLSVYATSSGRNGGSRSPMSLTDPDQAAGLTARDVEVLDEEIHRMERLLEGFLDFARPPRPEKRRVDLRQLVDQTLHILSPRARQRAAILECSAPKEPTWMHADEGQIRQLLLNLLLNALQAVDNHGKIGVEIRREGDGRAVVLRVVDDGRGLPEDLHERLFEPFFSTRETGLGLGLAVCRRIVEAHGGQITAANRSGGGAVFVVSLPVAA